MITEKEMITYKVRHDNEWVNRVQFPCAVGKMKAPEFVQSIMEFRVLKDTLVKISHAFSLIIHYIQAIG